MDMNLCDAQSVYTFTPNIISRLQVLVLCGPEYPHLEDFAEKFLRKGRGALILGNVIVQDLDDYQNSEAIEAAYEVFHFCLLPLRYSSVLCRYERVRADRWVSRGAYVRIEASQRIV